MTIIAGLGNPEPKYKNTPHNAGFEAVDEFAKENSFPEFKLSKKFNALISKKDNILLVKPQTYMNNSGSSLKKIRRGRASMDLIVLHDDIDLELGKIKVSKNRGSAGHKGINSIIKELGTKDFTRIRIGVSQDNKPNVLKKFDKEEKELLMPAILQAIKKLSQIIG